MDVLRTELRKKPWFKASDTRIQQSLMTLGEECRGFIADLEKRPDVIGGVRILAMTELLIPHRAIFGIFPVFLVQRIDNPTVIYTYQYFSWRQGPSSGAKGILFIKDSREGKITHLVINSGEKFATGQKEFDCFGGFDPGDKASFQTLIERFKTELLEELGLTEIEIEEIIDLGEIKPDPGMTNNAPRIFAAVVSSSSAHSITEGKKDNPDIFELSLGTVIVPIEKVNDFLMRNPDGYCLSAITRFIARQGNVHL